MASIKETLTEIMTLTPESKLPMDLKQIIRDTFKCHICRSVPAKPLLIITKCCRTMLGCERCVNQWDSGPEAMTKTCLMCKAERGCNETMILQDLNKFLASIEKLFANEDIMTDSNHQID